MANYDDPKKLYLRERLSCRAEVDGRVFSFDVRIEDIDAKGILTSNPDLGGPVLDTGQEVLIRYFRSDSAYQFLTHVLGYEEHGIDHVMRVGFPRRITRFQRRRHVRADLGGSIRFYPPGEIQPLRGFVKDVSAGGVQFSTRQMGMFDTAYSPVGQSIRIDLTLSDGSEFVGLVGESKRVGNDPERRGFVRVQVQFSKLSDKARDRLAILARRNA